MNVVRARDLRRNIKELGFEKGVTVTLELALEEQSATRQHIAELTALVKQCIAQVETMIRVGANMAERVESLQRITGQEDSDGSTRQ